MEELHTLSSDKHFLTIRAIGRHIIHILIAKNLLLLILYVRVILDGFNIMIRLGQGC
jgi:hypothetical protein